MAYIVPSGQKASKHQATSLQEYYAAEAAGVEGWQFWIQDWLIACCFLFPTQVELKKKQSHDIHDEIQEGISAAYQNVVFASGFMRLKAVLLFFAWWML